MGVYGRDIQADMENGVFNFEYDIDFNGSEMCIRDSVCIERTARMPAYISGTPSGSG